MEDPSGTTTIKVTKATKKKLEDWKGRYGAPSMDVLLQMLVVDEDDHEEDAGGGGDDEAAKPAQPKRRKSNVRDPLYSLDILAERDGMLHYLTGLNRDAIDLIISRVQEVIFSPAVLANFVFFLLPFAPLRGLTRSWPGHAGGGSGSSAQ